MGKSVLIAYATKHGATAEIAGRIGSAIRKTGTAAEVMAVKDANDISSYDAVILGSAVYIGSWRKEASKFLKDNADALKRKMVWLFSTGPTGKGEPVEMMDGWMFPKGLLPVAEKVDPVDIAVFHGSLDLGKLNGFEKWIIKKVQSATGDFRDWGMIDEWSSAVAEAVAKAD